MVRKFSLLGLVLAAASAVTAAVVPSGIFNDHEGKAGTMLASSGGEDELTCVPRAEGTACTVTVDSSTTEGNGTSDLDHSGSSSTGIPNGNGHTGLSP